VGEPHILSAAAALPEGYVRSGDAARRVPGTLGPQALQPGPPGAAAPGSQVGGRHLALPLEQYASLDSFAKRNDAWIAAAVEIGEKALTQALLRADLRPRDLDHLYFVTSPGSRRRRSMPA